MSLSACSDQPLLAAQPNQAMGELARQLAANDVLRRTVEVKLAQHGVLYSRRCFAMGCCGLRMKENVLYGVLMS